MADQGADGLLSLWLRKQRLAAVYPYLTGWYTFMDWIQGTGVALAMFSWYASEEHETLSDRVGLVVIGDRAGLCLVSYRRFLLGANQIAAFERGCIWV